jgi:MFS family permease
MRDWLKSRKAQVPSLIALHFFVGFVFWYGIEKIFLAHQLNIGPSGIAVIVTLYMVMTLVLDVPASVLADCWGRRRMLTIAVFCFILANIVLGSSQTFTMYLVGTALWAFFTVSYNGTYEATLFDSLKEENREKDFQKIDAWSRLFFMLGITISSIASGFIANWLGLRDVYFASIVPLICALVALAIIHEPSVHHGDEVEEVMKKGYISHLLHAFSTVWNSPTLRLVMFGAIILFFIQTPLYEFNQYVYILLFKTPVLVGIVGGLGGFVLAIGFFIAIRRKRPFSIRILVLLAGVAMTMEALLANNYSLFFLAVALIAGSILENALQTELQHATTSRTRASVTSAVYFVGNVLIVPFIFLFGAVAQNDSIWLAYLITGGVVLAMALGYFLLSRRTSSLKSL